MRKREQFTYVLYFFVSSFPLPFLASIFSPDFWREEGIEQQVKGCDQAGSKCFKTVHRLSCYGSCYAPHRSNCFDTGWTTPLQQFLVTFFGTWGSTLQLYPLFDRILISLGRSILQDPWWPHVSSLHIWWYTSGPRKPCSHPFHWLILALQEDLNEVALSWFCQQSLAFLSYYLTRNENTVDSSFYRWEPNPVF